MTTIPWIKDLQALDGFEFYSFWIGASLFAVGLGFLIDWIMKRSAYGPAFNAACAISAAYGGVYLRYKYFPGHYGLEPTLTACAAVIAAMSMLILLGLVRRKGF